MSDLLNDLLEDKPMEIAAAENEMPEYLSLLPDSQREKAYELSERIDYKDLNSASAFGLVLQQKLSNFSNQISVQVQNSDTLKVSNTLDHLIEKIGTINLMELAEPDKNAVEKKTGFFSKMFGFDTKSEAEANPISQYQILVSEVDDLAKGLGKESQALMNDLKLLDNMYTMNKDYYSAISIYVAAGKIALANIENKVIPELQQKASLTNDPMLNEEIQDLVRFHNQLEKKVHDLHLSQQISLQKAPQIRIIQENNRILVEKIQSSVLNTIPLWKDQFIMYLTLQRQAKAVEIQKKVNDTTNDLLMKNSELLKMNTVAIARENERGLVDLETLQATHANLISTVEEVLQIQAEGRANRQSAEKELIAMDKQLNSVMMKH